MALQYRATLWTPCHALAHNFGIRRLRRLLDNECEDHRGCAVGFWAHKFLKLLPKESVSKYVKHTAMRIMETVHSHLVDTQLASSNMHRSENVCITPVSSTAQTGLYCSSHTKSHCRQSDRLGTGIGAAGLAVRKPWNIFTYAVTIRRLGSLYPYMSTEFLLS
jgi:hypothetical protein